MFDESRMSALIRHATTKDELREGEILKNPRPYFGRRGIIFINGRHQTGKSVLSMEIAKRCGTRYVRIECSQGLTNDQVVALQITSATVIFDDLGREDPSFGKQMAGRIESVSKYRSDTSTREFPRLTIINSNMPRSMKPKGLDNEEMFYGAPNVEGYLERHSVLYTRTGIFITVVNEPWT